MQKSTLIGLAAGFLLIFGAIFLGTGWQTFFDIPALLIVIGGTGCGMLVNYTLEDMKNLPEALKAFLNFTPPDLNDKVDEFTEISSTARREGLLALDRALDDIDDELLKFGLELAIDGTPEDEILELTDRWIERDSRQRRLVANFFTTAGTLAPAFGMIGTLIGLIQMLQNLDDPTQIGAGMATAMVTTFYGAFLANLICLPIAGKAGEQRQAMSHAYELTQTGILAVVRGDRPSQIERRLKTFVHDAEDAGAPIEDEDEPLAQAA